MKYCGCAVKLVTSDSDALYYGVDEGLPASSAQSLRSLCVREETVSKHLLMTQRTV